MLSTGSLQGNNFCCRSLFSHLLPKAANGRGNGTLHSLRPVWTCYRMCFYPAGSVLWWRIMLYNIQTPHYRAMAASCHTQDIHELLWPRGRVYRTLGLLQSTYNDGLCEWLADECVSVFLSQVKRVNGWHFRMEWKTVCECVRIPMCPPHFSLDRLLPQSYKEWANVRAVNLTKGSQRVEKKSNQPLWNKRNENDEAFIFERL